MLARATRRLTWLYVVLFALVLSIFSAAFWLVLSIVLQPNFDLAPELSGGEVADVAYRTDLARIAVALVAADIVAIVAVAVAAWFLARRTLQPIREATERQARFVADASHEIRSPIAAIRTTAEAGLIGDRSPDELRAALTTVVASSARLASVSNDLLMLARSDHGEQPPSHEPFDLSVAVAEAVEAQRAAVEPIALSLAPDLSVRGDPAEVSRIVANLVDNSIRHGGRRVAVRTLATAGDAIVEVRDNGPGIPAEDLNRIFEPFYRTRADQSAPHGTGLGLAIAASLARRNGGRITVESRPGAGATFRLVLPALH